MRLTLRVPGGELLGVSRAVLVGNSGGGGVALGLSLADPDRVAGLALLARGVEDYPWPADDPFGREFRALFEAGDREGMVALGLRTWAAAGPGPEAQIRSGVRALCIQGDLRAPVPPAFDRLHLVRAPAVLLPLCVPNRVVEAVDAVMV